MRAWIRGRFDLLVGVHADAHNPDSETGRLATAIVFDKPVPRVNRTRMRWSRRRDRSTERMTERDWLRMDCGQPIPRAQLVVVTRCGNDRRRRPGTPPEGCTRDAWRGQR